MPLADELAALFQRDLTRLIQQIQAFADESVLWQCAPGVTNSAGNLVLHLEGNLREYIGRQLGGVPYTRTRDREFSQKELAAADLAARIEDVRRIVPAAIAALSDEQLQATYPENVLGPPLPTQQFLIHLNGHFNYHLGQIDYLRRILTGENAIEYVRL